ncbi:MULTISPECIES: hypothetical protein [unclassified Streptomyces]|uniref:hypothetical protein n=1 Tax=unclassified Streptomyces TaxID=2593676 RepID=UPI0006ADBB88|nr:MULTISPECIES: hypothetical protein [unclassified Streptomyces]KOU88684.1 hypothetical protein ADK93_12160 [Streptomyces sp. XY58]KOV03634.1 hypothetical protein ADK89_26215 [Streptomyces sp. XY37]KOV46799.1 hypothetical protein ADK99_21035 [Streptomyces sp. MMG1064]
MAVRRRPGRREGAFDLGRLELPVAVCAPAWTLLALFVLVTPREALVPVVVVASSTAAAWTPNPAPTPTGSGPAPALPTVRC